MPQSKQNSANRVYNRIFVNTTVKNCESVNWKADYKMFSGVSYASIVKVKTQRKPASLNQGIITTMKPKTNSNEARTSDIRAKNSANLASIAPLTKRSDVASKFKMKNDCRSKFCNVFTQSNYDAIQLY